MTITTLDVASEVSKSATFGYGGGSSDFTNLHSPDNDDTDFMANGTPTGDSRFTLDDLPSDARIVTQVESYFRWRSIVGESSSTLRPKLTTPGGTVNAGTRVLSSFVYNSFQDIFADAPAGSGWAVSDINACDIHFEKTASGGSPSSGRCTTLKLDVTWDVLPVSAILIASWLPPLIAVASHALSFIEISRILAQGKHRPSERHEFEELVAAFLRRPRFAFIGG